MYKSKRSLSMILALIMVINIAPAGLAEFMLPSSLKKIEAEAFDGNTLLTGTLTLPAGVTTIGDNAFRGSNLYALRLPAEVAEIDTLGLSGDQSIAYLYLEGALTTAANVSGARYIFGPASSAMNAHAAFISTDALIESNGFYYNIQNGQATLLCAVEDVEIPVVVTIPAEVNGYPVTAIGPHAFWQLEQVTTIILSSNVTEDQTAFSDVPHAEIIRQNQNELTLLSVTADVVSPYTVGDTVTWTANAVGGTEPYKYRFALYYGSTRLEQTAYTTSSSYSYTFLDAGEYHLVVNVRDGNMDNVSLTTDTFVVRNVGAGIEVTEIMPSVPSAKVNETVIWTANADNGVGLYRYSFELKDESGKRVAYCSYNSSNTFSTTIATPGFYSMTVSVLDEDNNSASTVYEGFEVFVEALSIASITVNPEEPFTGEEVTWTVVAEDGLQPYSYSFSIGDTTETNDSGIFTHVFDKPGSYTLNVSVADANGNTAEKAAPISVALQPLEIAAITATPKNAQTEDEVTWTVDVIGGTGDYTYAFILFMDGEELDSTSYQNENVFIYTPEDPGEYYIEVYVRDSAHNTTTKNSDIMNVALKPLKALDVELPESVIEIGTAVSLIAKGEGGQKPFRYSFEIYSGNELVKATSYSLSNTLSYTADTAGEYTIVLYIRDSAGTVSKITGSTKLTVYDHLVLNGIESSTDTTFIGDKIRWTADVAGGKQPLTYDWQILCDSESVYELSTKSAEMDYAPLTAGEYTVVFSVTDAAGTTFEISGAAVAVSNPETTTDESVFTVSNGTITAYKGTDAAIVVPPSINNVTITAIGANAFKGNTAIESVILPSTVTSIGTSAFQNCTALLSVDLADVQTIGNSAFSGCTALKTVNVTKNLITIGSQAFYNCASIAAMNFPEPEEGDDLLDYGLKTIKEAAFKNCSSLKSVYLANTVTQIEGEAFGNCSALTEVNYPLSLTTSKGYSKGAFLGCLNLTYMEVPEGITTLAAAFFSNAPALKEVVLPSTLVQIASANSWDVGAFTGCSALESVNLPYGLETIGSYAFSGCTSLPNPAFSKTLQTIGTHAYYGCTSITALNFPELNEGDDPLDYGLKTIKEAAFKNCSNIKSIHLANTVTQVEDEAFSNCSALTEVNYPLSLTTSKGYSKGAFLGCLNLTYMEVPEGITTLAAAFFSNAPALKEVVLPSTLVQIASANSWDVGAFTGCSALESVNLPYGLETIGSYAFSGCTSLPNPAFPKTLQTIGTHSYYGCTSITALNFPELNEGDDPLDYGLKTIKEAAFKNCSNIKSIHLANTVTQVEDEAFSNCSALTEVNYPLSLTTSKGYSKGAFLGCLRLAHIVVPEGVTTLAAAFFSNAPALEEVTLPSTLVKIDNANAWDVGAFSGCTALERVNLPYGLETIGSYAFSGCTSLPNPVFSKALQTVGDGAYSGCTSVTALNFPEPEDGDDLQKYGLKTVGKSAFANCTSLKSAHLANTVTTIHEKAFANCTALTEVNYPLSLTSYHGYSDGIFQNCLRLKHIVVPEGVTTLATAFFSNAPALEEVTLPSTLVKIDNANAWDVGAFSGCTALERVNLPYGLETIGSYAFSGCTSLPNPVFSKVLQTVGDGAYSGCTSITALNFPEPEDGDDLQKYGLKTVGKSAFANCTSLKSAHLANTVTTIYEKAFANCTALTEVNYPLSLTSCQGYSDGIFQNCLRLTHIVVPEGVTTLAAAFFSNAPALEEVTLPSTLVKIDNANSWSFGAFTGCSALESVNLPYGLETIGSYAFSGCTSLGWTYVPTSVTNIHKTAFEKCGENLTIESEYNAYAISYAIEQGIPYYYLSLTGHQKPSGTLYLGYPFNLYGYVRSSTNVASVTATLYDESGAVLQSITVEPGETDYNLAGAVNRAFDFASLSLGKYHFRLEASTRLTSEVFYSCDFRIIKEPLSVKTANFDGPGMYMALNSEQPLTGTLKSNYAITAVEVTFAYDAVNDDGDITESNTVTYSDYTTGNTKNYDLSKLGAYYYTAQNSEVHMTITVSADGQTRTVYKADYIVTDNVTASGLILDTQKLNTFVTVRDNRDFFDYYSSYAQNVAKQYATTDTDRMILQLYLLEQDGYKEGMVGQFLDEFLTPTTADKNEYYVNIYKDEIVSFINAVGAEWIDSVGYNAELSYQVQETIAAYPSLKGLVVKDLSNIGVSKDEQKLMTMLIKNIEPLEPLLDCIDSADDFEEFSELLFRICQDFTCGLNVLDYLENSHTGNDEQEVFYKMAIDELREQYIGDYCARLDKMFDYLQKESISLAIKAGEKTLAKAFTTAIEVTFGITLGGEVKVILGIAKIFWKTYTEKTDFYQGPEEYTKFMTIYMTYVNAYYSYQEHFDTVYNGDRSDEALQSLITSFNVTRLAGIRVLRCLRSMNHIEGNNDYTILQEIRELVSFRDYFYVAE
ncbi:MAG: PKD domain-containing protein [Clostridiales bacterium]|nr:PKD domain-containing protein [Clostridiales bacterium]